MTIEEIVSRITHFSEVSKNIIPFYAYGDNEAAVNMADKLDRIAEDLQSLADEIQNTRTELSLDELNSILNEYYKLSKIFNSKRLISMDLHVNMYEENYPLVETTVVVEYDILNNQSLNKIVTAALKNRKTEIENLLNSLGVEY
jgi:hypothetical protein